MKHQSLFLFNSENENAIINANILTNMMATFSQQCLVDQANFWDMFLVRVNTYF